MDRRDDGVVFTRVEHAGRKEPSKMDKKIVAIHIKLNIDPQKHITFSVGKVHPLSSRVQYNFQPDYLPS
jgi:hypothetical protein